MAQLSDQSFKAEQKKALVENGVTMAWGEKIPTA